MTIKTLSSKLLQHDKLHLHCRSLQDCRQQKRETEAVFGNETTSKINRNYQQVV